MKSCPNIDLTTLVMCRKGLKIENFDVLGCNKKVEFIEFLSPYLLPNSIYKKKTVRNYTKIVFTLFLKVALTHINTLYEYVIHLYGIVKLILNGNNFSTHEPEV